MKQVRVLQKEFIYHKTMNKDIKDIMVFLIALLLTIVVIAGIYYGANRITKETPGTKYQLQGTPDHPAM